MMNLNEQLDREFSLYIRLRDTMPNGMFRCISCGNIKPFSEADCGHFFSRKHGSTRWDEDNCHAQCIRCNRFLDGNLVNYRSNLIVKIGQERFDELEYRHHQTRQWRKSEIKELLDFYKDKNKELKKEKGL